MKLGTVAYNNKIYNLDYMTAEEIKAILEQIEMDKKASIRKLKCVEILKKL